MANQKEIAQHLDLTPRRVHGLVKEGLLPASKGPGGYDLDACRIAYIRYLRGVSTGQVKEKRDGEGQPSAGDYQAQLEFEKWREKKRENDIEEKLVGPFSLIKDTIERTGSVIMANLEALPGEMKRANPELTSHDINAVKKTIAKCCQAISEMRVDDN